MSLKSARNLSRRLFLKGVGGATLALPLLESLLSREALAAATSTDRFAIFVRSGNGIVQEGSEIGERFFPRATGALTSAALSGMNSDRATSELAAFAPRLTLLRNVKLPFNRPSCGHSEAIVQLLTAQDHTGGPGNQPKANGESIDWRIARALNGQNQGPLTFYAGGANAYIGPSLSWSASQMRASAEASPMNAYMRLTGLSSAPSETQNLIATRRKSVNDLVRAQLKDVLANPRLSTTDLQRLQQHFDGVRDMETQMSCDLAADRVTAINAVTNPQANDVRPVVVQRFMDLAAWAFNCGLNHSATLQLGEGNDGTQYVINGSKLPSFHQISHRIYSDGSEGETIPNAVELHAQVVRLHIQLFKYLLERLDSYPAVGGGTLLDRTVASWMNDLGSGPPHSVHNLPWVMAGGAGGSLNTGRYLDLNGNVNLVLNTILSAVGVRKADGSPTDDFGSSTLAKGTVPGLLK